MRWLLLPPGVLLIALALLDALWTTIAPRGAGPLTKRASRVWWRASLSVHRRRRGAHALLALAGPALLVATFLLWVGLLWAGWLLVFSAEPGAVAEPSTGDAAPLAGRVYYVGFTLFTLGTGDYAPVGGTWEVLSAVASVCGLFVATLAVTYVVSVVSAVAVRRQLAGSIHSLGETPAALLRRAWDGSGFRGLDQQLPALGPALELHTQHHLAYPILHYFHSPDRRTAHSLAVASLDEALLLLAEGVAPGSRPAPAVLGPLRRTVASFLDTLGDAFISASPEAPPPPDLAAVSSAGIPTVHDAAFVTAVGREARRRRLLHGLVAEAGWVWDDVHKG